VKLKEYLKRAGLIGSIRSRLVLYFLLLLILPMMAFTAFEYRHEKDLIRESVMGQLTTIADSKLGIIEGWVNKWVGDITVLTDNILLREHFGHLVSNKDNPASLVQDPESSVLRDYLKKVVQSYGYTEATLCSTDGTVLVSTTEEMAGKSLKGVGYFESGLRTSPDKVHIEDVFYSKDADAPMMAFSLPIKSYRSGLKHGDGDIIGVAILLLDLRKSFYPSIAWSGLGGTGEILLARKEGDKVVFLGKLRYIKNKTFGFSIPINTKRPLPVYLGASGRSGIIETEDYRGVDVIAAYRFVPRTGWGLVAKVDASDAFEPVSELGKTAALTLALSTMFIITLILIISRTIITPMWFLAETTKKLSRGDFSVSLPEAGKGEIGELTRSFAFMAEELRKSNEEVVNKSLALEMANRNLVSLAETLEVKVRERTSELEDLTSNQAAVMKDLDERTVALERSQAELRKFAEELEESKNRVKENLEIVERANVELRRMDRMKDHFLGMISHELRTPLSLIMGYSSNLLADPVLRLNPSVEEELEGIFKGSDRLRNIITEMMDISRIDAKGLKLSFNPVSIGKMVSEVVREMDVFVRERKQAVEVGDFTRIPLVLLDRSKVYQVLVNVIGNAIKFTPDGGRISITPHVQPVSPDSGPGKLMDYTRRLDIVVRDSGIGLDKDEINRIFEKFYEVGDIEKHATSKYQFLGRGVGLGLPIARGIVEAHGGMLWAESEGYDPEKLPGSTFHIILPLRTVEEEQDVPYEAASAGEQPSYAAANEPVNAVEAGYSRKGPPHSDRHKVLVVEDDEDVLNLTLYVLKKKYDVYRATDGEEGIRLARMLKPKLILLDVYMEGMDGYTVCKTLKGDPETKDIKLAMFTAGVQRWEVEKGYSSGADDYITKPFKPDELIAKVDGLISGRLETANN